ncbi:PEP-CTERM sorting domain-containing protein [Nostoc sp. FACHB-973]|nr:PEP-CTERM sorting domain-containing protein [Nostoc sp. FACHB-973]MBX9252613.1 PEP-CTERM sorting domain-containing protein [Desmonostoc muscorum CCALA 125]
MKKFVLTAGIGLLLSFFASKEAKAANFTFNPTTTFEVGDGFFSEPFDGNGDTDAVFPGNFDTVVRGTVGENSENAEFDISGFSIPPLETITSAIFEATGLSNQVFGLGVSGERPTSLGVRGYVGNGVADASDFQAGTILDTVNVSPSYVQETYNFDVTAFIQNLVSNGNSFAGFGVRAQDFGGLSLDRGTFSGNRPRLIITTAPTASVPEPSATLGLLAFGILSGSSVLRRKQQRSSYKSS